MAPENTFVALERAKALGASWVEFDVQLSRDNEPVVFHDSRLSRTSNGAGLVRQRPWSYLRNLDVGGYFSSDYVDQRMPHLDDWLHYAMALGLGLNIELKTHYRRDAALLARAVAVSIARVGADPMPLLISAGNVQCLHAMRAVRPDLSRGLVASRINKRTLALCHQADCLSLNVDYRYITADNVALAQQQNLAVLVWTVNAHQDQQRCFDLGVDGIFSDVVIQYSNH